jgi:hypothetical protein
MSPLRKPRWSVADIKRLQNLLDAGKTADQIAAELGRTRLAVYGQVQRLYRKRDRSKARSDRDGPTWG